MPRTDSFVTYTLELLQPVGPLQARSMFGGWGIYFTGRMFGLIAEGQLYLKVDDETREAFRTAGGRPFIYEGGGKRMETSYWTPPPDAADDSRELVPWARRAIEAAERAAVKKPARAKKKATPAKSPAAAEQPASTRGGAAAKKKAPPARKSAGMKRASAKKAAATKKARGRRTT